MGKTTITKPFLESAQLQELGNAIAVSQNRINLDGLIGSSLSIVGISSTEPELREGAAGAGLDP